MVCQKNDVMCIIYCMSCDLYWCIMWPILMYHLTYTDVSCDLYWCIMWPILMYHVTYTDASFDLYWSIMWSVLMYHVTGCDLFYRLSKIIIILKSHHYYYNCLILNRAILEYNMAQRNTSRQLLLRYVYNSI